MGLDMYLYKEIYVGANYEHNEVKGKIELSNRNGPIPIKLERVSSIREQVGYWRKANAIHKWFVDNVQGGVDMCQESSVSRDQLQELLDLVNYTIENFKEAPDKLPSQDGFFFGSTSYGDSYSDDLILTKEILERVMSEPGDYFVYHSSW